MGATGTLGLDEDGVIDRELAWAVVRRGAYEPLSLVPPAVLTQGSSRG